MTNTIYNVISQTTGKQLFEFQLDSNTPPTQPGRQSFICNDEKVYLILGICYVDQDSENKYLVVKQVGGTTMSAYADLPPLDRTVEPMEILPSAGGFVRPTPKLHKTR